MNTVYTPPPDFEAIGRNFFGRYNHYFEVFWGILGHLEAQKNFFLKIFSVRNRKKNFLYLIASYVKQTNQKKFESFYPVSDRKIIFLTFSTHIWGIFEGHYVTTFSIFPRKPDFPVKNSIFEVFCFIYEAIKYRFITNFCKFNQFIRSYWSELVK